MSKEITSVAELVDAVLAAKEGEENQLQSDLKGIAQDGKAMQERIDVLEAENKTLKEVSANNAALASENKTLAEQVTALENALARAKEASKDSLELATKLAGKDAMIAGLQIALASLEVENQLDKGIAGLVFDANDKARNARMADLCKADWKAQYKVEKREELLVVIDKKTQKEVESTVSESIENFAKENGYTVKAATGLNISSVIAGVESANAGILDISYEDASSEDPKRREAFLRKKEEFATELNKKGITYGTPKYVKEMEKAGLMEIGSHRYSTEQK